MLLSHLHYDHLDIPSLAAIGVGTPIVVPRGGRSVLRGFEHVIEVDPGATLELAGIRLRVIEAVHDGRRRRYGERRGRGRVRDRRDVVGLLRRRHRPLRGHASSLGPLDVALLPVWGWGRSIGPGHLDPARAAHALALLRPRVAVPIHWGTYSAVWTRPADSAPADAFALAALQEAPEVEVRILPVGGGLEI